MLFFFIFAFFTLSDWFYSFLVVAIFFNFFLLLNTLFIYFPFSSNLDSRLSSSHISFNRHRFCVFSPHFFSHTRFPFFPPFHKLYFFFSAFLFACTNALRLSNNNADAIDSLTTTSSIFILRFTDYLPASLLSEDGVWDSCRVQFCIFVRFLFCFRSC